MDRCFTGTMPRESPNPLRRFEDSDKKFNSKEETTKIDLENEVPKK